jgi:hypothetical protein
MRSSPRHSKRHWRLDPRLGTVVNRFLTLGHECYFRRFARGVKEVLDFRTVRKGESLRDIGLGRIDYAAGCFAAELAAEYFGSFEVWGCGWAVGAGGEWRGSVEFGFVGVETERGLISVALNILNEIGFTHFIVDNGKTEDASEEPDQNCGEYKLLGHHDVKGLRDCNV